MGLASGACGAVLLLVFSSPALAATPDAAKEACEKGKAYLEKNEFDAAVAAFDKAIQLNPRDGDAFRGRGSAYFFKQKYDLAIASLNEAIRLDPKNSVAYANRGCAYGSKGDYDKAIADFSESIRLNPADDATICSRGIAYETKQDFDHAIADYTEAIRVNPRCALAYAHRSWSYDRNGQPDKVLADLDAALKINPRTFYCLERRGTIRIRHGDYDGGAADLLAAVALDRADPAAQFESWPMRRPTAEGLEHGKRQIAQMLRDRPAMAEFGEKTAGLREWAARKFAGEDMRQLIFWDATEPLGADADNCPPSDKMVGRIRNRKTHLYGPNAGQAQGFEDLWREVIFELYNITSANDFHRLTQQGAEGLLAKDAYIANVAYCEARAAERTRSFYVHVFLPWAKAQHLPTDPAAWFIGKRWDCKENLAISNVKRDSHYWKNYERAYDARRLKYLIGKGDDASAKAYAAQAVQQETTNEDKATVYAAMGIACLANRQYDKAIASYGEVIRIDPKHSAGYLGRGFSYVQIREYDRAVADYSEVIRLDPKNADAWVGRGAAYEYKGERAKAIADYTAALGLNPNEARAYFGRGSAYGNDGALDKAIADLTAGLRLEPNNATGFCNRGKGYLGAHAFDKAIADFSEAIRLDPSFAAAYCSRGAARFYQINGDSDLAIADCSNAIRLDPPNAINAYALRASVYERKGDKDKAAADRAMVEKLRKSAAEKNGAAVGERRGG
jgi:tetratricopeptide (TPR) repeat protein